MVEGGERGCSTVKASREAQTVVAGEGGDVQSGRGGGRAVDRSLRARTVQLCWTVPLSAPLIPYSCIKCPYEKGGGI